MSIFSSLKYDTGKILLEGKPIKLDSIAQAIGNGISLVPEDRKGEGIFAKMSLGENISIPVLDQVSTMGSISIRKRNRIVDKFIKSLSIKPPLSKRVINDFSGGNQQKAVIAKWLATNPKIIILDEPTRGVDVGAKTEIYSIIEKLSRSGVGIIFVSSELMEVIGLCDRIIVIHEGKINGEFTREEATQENLVQAASGF